MSQFVLIDHSLKNTGGHHFDYAQHILRAAEAAGYMTVLATNRSFRPGQELPGKCQVFPLFRHDTYSRYSVYCGKQFQPGAAHKQQGFSRLVDAWHSRVRRWRINHFSAACKKLFTEIPLAPGDHVMLPTLSEFDLAGLAQYLETVRPDASINWHLQFHFDVFAGRPAGYARQEHRRTAMRDGLRIPLQQAAGHRLHFYNTTEALTEQYDRLDVAKFATLPYPVNPAITPRQQDARPREPLRVTCAGYSRREKGRQYLGDLLQEMRAEVFEQNKIRLVIQGNRAKLRRMLSRRLETDPRAIGERIEFVRHPLAPEDYVDFLRSADIGLFLYDSERYYVRCSGILVELLSAGVPVIVPAGCWLSEQIAEANYCHLDRVADKALLVRDFITDGALTFGDRTSQALQQIETPAGATDLLVSFQWPHAQPPGTYIHVRVEQFDKRGRRLAPFAHVVGQRARGQAVPALFRVAADSHTVKLTWENAYAESQITVADARARFLKTDSAPLGSIGLIAAGNECLPRLLREMTANYAHYRQAAREFSVSWRRAHAPAEILKRLEAKARTTPVRIAQPAA